MPHVRRRTARKSLFSASHLVSNTAAVAFVLKGLLPDVGGGTRIVFTTYLTYSYFPVCNPLQHNKRGRRFHLPLPKAKMRSAVSAATSLLCLRVAHGYVHVSSAGAARGAMRMALSEGEEKSSESSLSRSALLQSAGKVAALSGAGEGKDRHDPLRPCVRSVSYGHQAGLG